MVSSIWKGKFLIIKNKNNKFERIRFFMQLFLIFSRLINKIITMNYNLLFLLLFLSSISFGQERSFKYHSKEIQFSKEFLVFYDDAYVSQMSISNPELLIYLNYYSTNVYLLVDMKEKATSGDFPNIETLKKTDLRETVLLSNLNGFNIFLYDIQLKDHRQYFIVENTNFALCIKSKEEFMNEFNQYKLNF